ncbi:MAG: MerR family transcriptional regulator [Frankiales bacterium]|jgi:chaperone modulatory protein CbpM|nr:MerR family transcriptional regulator [Frankiales bacterium]
MTTVLVRTGWLSLDALARQTGVHPDLIRRFVSLGLLDPEPGHTGEPHFRQRDVARVLRAQRLRAALGLNYASLGLVLDLLDRVAALEATQRRPARTRRRSDLP